MTRAEWRPLRIDWFDPRDDGDPGMADSGPELAVTVFPTDAPYNVTVEIRRDADGAPFVIGIAVRRQFPWWEDGGWMAGDERPHVSPRDVQRLPLARIVRAALAAASTAQRPTLSSGEPASSQVAPLFGSASQRERPEEEWAKVARKILVPRGRPQRGKSIPFYQRIADAHRACALAGTSPAKEIARRMNVSENTVHQWVHQARRHKLLEPSTRSRRPPNAPDGSDD